MVKTSAYVCCGCWAEYAERLEMCLSCWRTGLIVPQHVRPAAGMIPTSGGMTARTLAASDQRLFNCRAYPDIRLSENCFVVISGPPGHGKSTFALRFAESLTPSVFLPLEEGCGPSLAAKLRRLEIRGKDLWLEEPRSVEGILAAVDREGVRCVVVDSGSVASLLPSDWLALSRSKNLIVLATLQVTKAGQHAGSNKWLHDADVVLEAQDMVWSMSKSRYQETAGVTGAIL
jgi:predicted ATP-dependent serine protease